MLSKSTQFNQIYNNNKNFLLNQLTNSILLFISCNKMGPSHTKVEQHLPLPVAISSNFNFKNHDQYQFVRQIKRQNASSSPVFLFKNKIDKKYYVLRIIIVSMDDQLAGFMKIIQKRKKVKSLHLCHLKQCISQQETMTCATIHKLALLIECPPKSLKQQFQQKQPSLNKKDANYFRESQLWAITYSVIHGLKQLTSYGMHHQSLDLQQIYIDTNGLIKLADPILFGLQKNYITALTQKEACLKKLSPQLLSFLEQCNFFFYDKEQSDIFIMGLILLEITLLKEVSIYNFVTKLKRFGILKEYLQQVRRRYSQKYYVLLCWMLQIQPKNRPKCNDLIDFIQTNNVETSSSNNSSKHITSNQITPIASQIQFKHLPIRSQNILQNRTNNQNLHNPSYLNNLSSFQNNQYQYQNNYSMSHPHNTISPQTHNSFFNSPVKQFKQQTTQIKLQESNHDVVFPFELVYNRIVNNNQNLRPFQLPKLYREYKVQMFNSSCRGSVPSSSFHSKNLQISNHLKSRDIQTFSKKYGDKFEDNYKNSKHQSYQNYEKHDTNLVYSNSSGQNGSNRIFSSTKTLGDIKLIQSNHYINDYNANLDQKMSNKLEMQKIAQVSEVSSPYRKLNSLKSKSFFQNDSGNNTIFSSLKLPEYQNKIQEKKQTKYQYFNQNTQNHNNRKMFDQLQFEYHSLQTKKHPKEQETIGTFKSQFIQKQKITQNRGKSIFSYIQVKEQKFSNFQNFNMFCFKDQIIVSKNQLLDQSEMNSKLSVFTPNFYQKDRSKSYNDFMENSSKQDLIHVQKQISIEGNSYTGFRTKNGLKQGQGKLQFHDGGYYDGEWKNNQMNGYGEMFYENGQVAYKGSWKNDHFCGSGKVYNDRPEQLNDEFNYRDFSQIGQKWLSYQGQFDSDSKHGKGRIDLTNGQYFQGTFDYDMIQGYGTYYTKDENKIIRGVWRDNQLIEMI